MRTVKDLKAPYYLKEEYLTFLDNLRSSGVVVVNAFGWFLKTAYPELLENQEREVLSYWMKTYSQRHKR